MQIEDLIFEDDARGYLENMSDFDALIVVAVDDGSYGAGRLTGHLCSHPSESPPAPQYQGLELALLAK